MPKLYSSEQIIKTLNRLGFVFVSQKGSYIKLRKLGIITLNVIVSANRKEIPLGTFRSILKQAELTEKEFNT